MMPLTPTTPGPDGTDSARRSHPAWYHPAQLVSLLSLTLGIAAFQPPAAQAATQPNILVILTDDAGYGDFGFQGGGIDGDFAQLTPNLDALAAEGVRFTNGYVAGSICCPSRAGLLTGRYPQRFGFQTNTRDFPQAGLATSERTMAARLRALGYRTYAVGKWHLGESLPAYHPNQRGFDEFIGFLGGARTYFQYMGNDPKNRLQHNGLPLPESPDQYLTDVFGSAAADLITSHVTGFPDQPFFLYLAFNGVHDPMEADAGRLADPRIQAITESNRKTLAAMTLAVDDAVGTVLDTLAQLGQRENTLVVFLNDNGGPEDNPDVNALNWSDNGPLRDGKRSLHEGGIRVPFVVNWPGTIPSAPGGRVIDDAVISLDLLPTFIAAAGGTVYPDIATDGINLLPRLTGITTNPIERCLFWRSEDDFGEQSAVRQGNWKVHRDVDGSVALYDLATDIGESHDLADRFPERVAGLLDLHALWEQGMIEPLWGFGEPIRSSPELRVGASSLGYLLDHQAPGSGWMSYERRTPLPMTRDWSLTWSLDSREVDGASRDGYIVLGDGEGLADLIRVGVDLDAGNLFINEPQTGTSSQQSFPAVPELTHYFMLSFDASVRELSLHYGTNAAPIRYEADAVSHVLTGVYGDLTHAGHGVQAIARTAFSPIKNRRTPVAAGRSPSWARLKMTRNYRAGGYDKGGNFMGGTELLSLVVHQGRLFAGNGYWNDERWKGPSDDPFPGSQVLVKDSASSAWRQDVAFGADHLRVESLRSLTLTTDREGALLDPPMTLLMAGTTTLPEEGPPAREVHVFVRNDASGTWTPTSPGMVTNGLAAARFLFEHVDRVTGIHHVFCAFGTRAVVVRGGYDQATGLIVWEPEPELTSPGRLVSGGDCNGWLYACVWPDGDPHNEEGGLFWREDGPAPRWHFAYEWPKNEERLYQDVRGFTALPHPHGFNHEIALVTLTGLGTVSCIDPIGGDPRNGHIVTEELNIQQFLGDFWNDGVPIGFNTIAAYNDMPEVIDPSSGKPVNLLGLYVNHPAGHGTPEGNNTWYLVRHRDGTYDWAQVIDPADPIPSPFLRACRAVRASPFPEETGRVVYFGGFDGGGATPWHNTAWIYRAELAGERALIRLDDSTPVVGIDTAYGWRYQLEAADGPGDFHSLGEALPGNNAIQEVRIDPPSPTAEFFRWGIAR